MLAASLPISLNGWGIREFLMIYVLDQFGINERGAFYISVTIGILSITAALLNYGSILLIDAWRFLRRYGLKFRPVLALQKLS
ncbi:MAG: hypothetical protein ACKOAD_07750 [Gammaproteobacteria bacterium]